MIYCHVGKKRIASPIIMATQIRGWAEMSTDALHALKVACTYFRYQRGPGVKAVVAPGLAAGIKFGINPLAGLKSPRETSATG